MFGLGKIWWERKGADKPLPNVRLGSYVPNWPPPPAVDHGPPKRVKRYSEKELRAQHDGLNDAYENYQTAKEQYEMLLGIYESSNWKPFERAKSI